LATNKVRCWGLNHAGQLGYQNTQSIGDKDPPASAKDVKVLENLDVKIQEVVAGGDSTCVLLEGGQVYCWGSGSHGNMGQGNSYNIGDSPGEEAVLVDLGGSARQLALGRSHSCALLEEGNVRCWGYSLFGQSGTGFTHDIGDNPGEMPPLTATLYPNP